MNTQLHMMHMRYLVYRDAIVKAIRLAHREMRLAHREMKDYSKAFAEMERTR